MKAVFRAMVLAVLASASLTAQAEPPEMSGSVIRFETNLAWLFFDARDPSNTLTVILGVDPVRICALGLFDPDLISIQRAVIQDGQRIVSHLKADVYATVS